MDVRNTTSGNNSCKYNINQKGNLTQLTNIETDYHGNARKGSERQSVNVITQNKFSVLPLSTSPANSLLFVGQFLTTEAEILSNTSYLSFIK